MRTFLLPLFILFILNSFSQDTIHQVKITHLYDNFYVHTSFKLFNNVSFPSNGLIVITKKGAILIDTPWDESQTFQLVDSLELLFHKKIILCIVTHSHDDRTAGLEVLKKKGVKTYSSKLTHEISIENNEKIADSFFSKDTVFNIDSLILETYFPGKGHTKDNIVIWFPKSKILFGGCAIKSIESKGLGNINDANLIEWPKSIQKIINKYPEIKYIIPGHMSWSSNHALTHTLLLLNNHQ